MCSRSVDTPTDNLQCFPYVHLFVAGRNNIHHPLSSAPASLTHERDFSTIFSNFQNILSVFFHNRYILTTNLVTFFKIKNLSLSFSWKMSPEREVSRRLFWAVSNRETALSAGRSRLVVSKSFTKQHFQAPVAYWMFGPLNMNIIRLLIRAKFATQTHAVCWMRQNSNITKTTAYIKLVILV